jgi:hypothetical protein
MSQEANLNVRIARNTLLKCTGDPRLTDAGLPAEQHRMSFAAPGLYPSMPENLHLGIASNQW